MSLINGDKGKITINASTTNNPIIIEIYRNHEFLSSKEISRRGTITGKAEGPAEYEVFVTIKAIGETRYTVKITGDFISRRLTDYNPMGFTFVIGGIAIVAIGPAFKKAVDILSKTSQESVQAS